MTEPAHSHAPGPASLKDRTLIISGATRGIGLAIALRAARDGANITVLGKTGDPHPRLPGTVGTACAEVESAGGRALGIVCDIRDEEQVEAAVAETVERFGGIDILVNNASAIHLAGTETTSMKRYDLMHQVNARGTYLCAQKCFPHLKKSDNGHILTMSPPLHLHPEFFGKHVAYSIAKFGMSLCTLGWAEELRGSSVAANSLWPRTIINTAAVQNLLGGEAVARQGRTPEIVADAAYEILTRPSSFSGNFVMDEDILREAGVTDFERYAVTPGAELMVDLFVPT
jgi:citronellol/citronellal dehydrogenase